MPRRMSSDQKLYFWTMATLIVVASLSLLVFLIKMDYNSPSEPEYRSAKENVMHIDPKLQMVLDDMARSFRKWDR